jgi:hypothetical protein
LSVPNNWVFRRTNKRLAGPQALYFCPSFATTNARGGRQARGLTERLTTGGWCAQVGCHSLGEARKSAGFIARKACRSRHANCSRSVLAVGLLVKHNRFQRFSIGIWIGTQEFTFQIGQFWNVIQVPTQNPIQFWWLERGWEGFTIQSKKMDWKCDLERPVEMLLGHMTV